MPEGRPIIIRQSQTQNGCCAGTGCGTIVGIVLLLAGVGAVLDAMGGAYGTGWQTVAWIGVPLLVVLVILGAVGMAGERFGWFEQTPEPVQRDAAEVIVEDEMNYGVQEEEPSDDLEARLRRLATLRDQGLITAEDYEAQKRRLLDNM